MWCSAPASGWRSARSTPPTTGIRRIFWDAAAPLVYDIGGYKIYDVRQFQTS